MNKFQEWYTNVFGGIDDPRIKYLTALEKPWHDVNCAVNKGKWVPCDQLIMAVYLDDSCITSRESYWVCIVPILRITPYFHNFHLGNYGATRRVDTWSDGH